MTRKVLLANRLAKKKQFILSFRAKRGISL
jgi:hypothetical protein